MDVIGNNIANVNKQVERRSGAEYVVSPFQLLINDGNYYLLAFDGKKIIKVKPAVYMKSSTDAELLVMSSIMRRLGIKPQIFNFRRTGEK